MDEPGAPLEIEGLVKRFGAVTALEEVSLSVGPGELFTLLGPSGCGKTTLLRSLAGFETPDAGSVRLGGDDLLGLPAHRRRTGLVFQRYALFPHLDVFENVAFGLRSQRRPEPEIRRRVAAMLALVRLEGLERRRPAQLSGGQQQRVGIARALASQPRLLLMDEPLSNLDAQLRVAMRDELRALQQQAGTTTVYVTHDQEEALAISDRVAVLAEGRAQQVGTPWEVYRRPANRFVAGFVGRINFLAPDALPPSWRELLGDLEPGAELALRPEDLGLGEGQGQTPLRVLAASFTGATLQLRCVLGEGELQLALRRPDPERVPAPGDEVPIGLLEPAAALRFDADGGRL